MALTDIRNFQVIDEQLGTAGQPPVRSER